jgi:hypothetical protein
MVAIISEGSPSFILLSICILEQSDASLSRTIHRRCGRTRSRTLYTQSLSPRSGIGPRHQLYAALSGLSSKGEKRQGSSFSFLCSSSRVKTRYLHQVLDPQSSHHSSETPGHPGPRLHNLLLSRVDARTSTPRTSMIAIGTTR